MLNHHPLLLPKAIGIYKINNLGMLPNFRGDWTADVLKPVSTGCFYDFVVFVLFSRFLKWHILLFLL
jgi:hypothetical protein